MIKATITLALALGFLPGPPLVQQPDQSVLSKNLNKRDLIVKIASIIEKEHFDAVIGKSIYTLLTNNEGKGKYNYTRNGTDLVAQINKDISEVSKDQHLQLNVPTQTLISRPSRSEIAIENNYGINKIEILDHNVAIIRITAFYRPEESWNKIRSALFLIKDADAIIIDLRGNGGGSPQTMKKLISQFLGVAEIPLYKFIERDFVGANIVTEAPESGLNLKDTPLYILTSKDTFSAAEGFVFFLKEHRQVTVIGEKTSGSSNRAYTYKINDMMELTVPNASIKSIKTGLNWEGLGIVPDIVKPNAEAPSAAYEIALANKVRIQRGTLQ